MVDELLIPLAPHLCCSCGKIGALLCESCKYDIKAEAFSQCIACGRSCGKNGICRTCKLPYRQAFIVGWRHEGLESLINRFKFERARSGYKVVADLMLDTLPELPADTVVVPIPTIRPHVRQRGYDHTLLIARRIAKRRQLAVSRALKRKTATVQRDASARVRQKQAREAYVVAGKLDPAVPYLIVDDVVTTGSTLKYATRALKAAGAQTVLVAAAARQPLDVDGSIC